MLPLPSDTTDARELADWLEFNALVSSSGQVSLDDLRNALRIGALGATIDASPVEIPVQLESIAAEVWGEVETRVRRAHKGYPFRLLGSSLERRGRGRARGNFTYTFCLLLSFVPWEDKRVSGYFPDRIFEEVSCHVAERYLCGKAIRFGWPRVRSVLSSRFGEAVSQLCERMGEGTGFRDDMATGEEGDASLDVVAWSPIDDRSGKMLLFGACATGRYWESKLDELQPKHFCRTYLKDPVTPEPTKAFFTPRVIPSNRWRLYSSRAGILFDRCRVSGLIPELPSMGHHGNVQDWMEVIIKQVHNEATS